MGDPAGGIMPITIVKSPQLDSLGRVLSVMARRVHCCRRHQAQIACNCLGLPPTTRGYRPRLLAADRDFVRPNCARNTGDPPTPPTVDCRHLHFERA